MKTKIISLAHEEFLEISNDISKFLILPSYKSKLVAWQLKIAGINQRDILFTLPYEEISNAEKSKLSGINHAVFAKINGSSLNLMEVNDFKVIETIDNVVKISSQSLNKAYEIEFIISYFFYDLRLKSEISLKNLSGKNITWNPSSEVLLNVPWNDVLNLQNYNLFIPAKNIFIVDDNGQLKDQKKFIGEINLSSIERQLFFQNFKENLFKVETLNGEESISFEFDKQNKYSSVYVKVLDKNCLSVTYSNSLIGLLGETIMDGASSNFSFEISLN